MISVYILGLVLKKYTLLYHLQHFTVHSPRHKSRPSRRSFRLRRLVRSHKGSGAPFREQSHWYRSGDGKHQCMPWIYLAQAAARGWAPLVRFLLAHGAQVNATRPEELSFSHRHMVSGTALEAATEFGHLEVAK